MTSLGNVYLSRTGARGWEQQETKRSGRARSACSASQGAADRGFTVGIRPVLSPESTGDGSRGDQRRARNRPSSTTASLRRLSTVQASAAAIRGRRARRRAGGPDEDAAGRGHAARHRAPARRHARGGAPPGRRARLRDGARSDAGGRQAPAPRPGAGDAFGGRGPRPARCRDRGVGVLRRVAPVRDRQPRLGRHHADGARRAAAGPCAGPRRQTPRAAARTCGCSPAPSPAPSTRYARRRSPPRPSASSR